ncbi:TonB-dependent receptor [Caulobacter sp. NIBR1757]|uniref:TonB-dependent receptor plug domain-containing protein n=1 Tax=Caulobacter sp. NIBR1757 TaxID=3016000 RepID=UPI0022F0E071|nr:TonB-dependent receptor [Caulobacter sp. NIBR1757]WGM37279.1 Vitamin B12 transporter BtuB [Caulobacter sp. NIBR1757]
MTGSSRFTKSIALGGASLLAIMLLAAAAPALAQAPAAPDGESPDSGADVEEIIVTGTSIRGVPPTGSNLISVTRDDIEMLGGANTPDLTSTIPQLSSFNTAPTTSAGTGPGLGSFAPALRGLPANATLPLMNGHRLVSAAVQVTNPDYPLIPNLAVERIEVVADGASSIYGSDAVAGVVNFITRRKVEGVEVSASYGAGEDYSAGHVSGLVGEDWGSGSILAAYQYTENSNLLAGDRDYRITDFRPYGGIDSRSVACPSPTVYPNPTYTAPYQAPTFTAGANRCDSGALNDLLPSSAIHALFVSGRQELGDRTTLWADVLYSDRHDEYQVAAPALSVGMLSPVFGGNPFFKGPPGAFYELISFRADNLIGSDHLTNTNDKSAVNSSFGIDVKLPRELNLSVYGTVDWAMNDSYVPGLSQAALDAAAAGTTTATALDPFGTGTAPAVVAAILDYPTHASEEQRVNVAAAKLDGPLFDLPGGPLKFAVGAEYRFESFEQRGYIGTPANDIPENMDRTVLSLYGEVFVPIVGPGNTLPMVKGLALSLSGRYDDYSDFGTTTNPKVGVYWQLVDGLSVRGSYGTSFRAPGLRQIGATVGAYYLSAPNSATYANDPTRGAAQVETIYLLGGNTNLQPEEATTWSAGIDVNPTFLPNLRASLTYYKLEYTDVIGTPSVPYVFQDPTFDSIVYRGNPASPAFQDLLAIATPVNLPASFGTDANLLDLRNNNFGVRETDGLDFDVNYYWTTGFGSVFADLAGNYILNFDTRISPASPVTNSLDLGLARWTARATLAAQAGPVSLAGFVNYRDGVKSLYTTPTGVSSYRADSYVTVDLRASWTLPDTGWTRGAVVAVQVNDLFDADPPFFPATDGVGGSYNPIGRFIGLNLRKTF